MRSQSLAWWLSGVGLGAIGIVLFAFDPQQVSFFPRCPLYAFTGLQCAGCGSQRALHALSHADLAAAWAFNPLAVAAVPYMLLGWVAEFRAQVSTPWARCRRALYGTHAIWAVLVIITVFTVGRNVW